MYQYIFCFFQTISDDCTHNVGSVQCKMLKDVENNDTLGFEDWICLQRSLKCCGVHSYTDWKNNVPTYCCNTDQNTNTNCTMDQMYNQNNTNCTVDQMYNQINTKGCLQEILKNDYQEMVAIGIGVTIISIIIFLFL